MGLYAQINAFVLTLILGILAGLIFHYYLLTVKKLRLRIYFLYLMDFILWILMICVVAVGMLLINQGEMRIYVFISLILGVIAYFKFLSTYTKKTLETMALGSARLLTLFYKILFKPVNLLIVAINSHRKHPPPDNELD